jgi:hypothetical protein
MLTKGMIDELVDIRAMKLGDVIRIARGVVTGNAALFIMTRAEAQRRDIEAFVKPILAGKREFPETGPSIVRDSPGRKVVLVASKRDVEQNANLAVYLAGVEPRLSAVRPAPMAVTYVGQPRFVANPDGLLITNALYTATPRQNMTPKEILDLVEHLNRAMTSQARPGFARRFSPRELEAVTI